MPKFTIFARETVYYAFDIEAESKEQAIQKANDYELSFDDATESENFEIQGVEEMQDAY